MKTTIRLFIFCALWSPYFLFHTLRAAEDPAAQTYFVHVGNTRPRPKARESIFFEFSADTGQLTAKGLAGEATDPSWIAIHPSGKFLYAANESGKASTISAFSIDAKTGKLTLLNKLPALGEDPCYLSFDQTGKYLLVANYTSGNVVVFPIGPDGSLGEHTSVQTDPGVPGPNTKRQDGPHAHWIEPSGNNHFVSVADLGVDRVLFYHFDESKGTLRPGTPVDEFSAAVAPAPARATSRLATTENSCMSSPNLPRPSPFLRMKATKRFRSVQQVSALPKDFQGRNDAAEIAILPNGRFLYTSNRGHDSIAVFPPPPPTPR